MKDDQQQTLASGEKPKKRRFQLIKLEERIAPAKGGNAGGNGTNNCWETSKRNCGGFGW